MKKRIVCATAIGMAACMLFSGCGSKEKVETDAQQTIEEAATEVSAQTQADEAQKESSETAADTAEQESTEENAVLMQSGEAVYYGGQVLFRNYSSQSISHEALWGEFQRDEMLYVPGSLCTFDPEAPEKGITTICEDSGNGCLYLKDGNILYSQKVTDFSQDGAQNVHVYKKTIPGGEDEEICPGEIRGFSPDGEHFVVYRYTTDPYQVHYYIYQAGDKDADTAHYEPVDGAIFLTIDNDNAYFLEQSDDNTHIIVQVSNNGNVYKLGKCDFSGVAEYGISFPEFSNEVTTENGELKVQFDFYEGTGHFYYASAKVSVPICQDTEKEAGDSTLYDAKVEAVQLEDDPQYVFPKEINDMVHDYPSQESGSGVANVIQNYQQLDEGIFFTKAQSHRDPFEDIGWRESYCLLNYYYYFLPKGEKEPVLLHTMFEPLGKKGNLTEYEYYETQPTIYAYAGFYADKDGKLVGAYYEEIYTEGPETPIKESNLYHMAEFSDEFYYEHPKDEDSFDDFVVEDPGAFSDYIYSWIPQNKVPVRTAKYDENGNLKYEPELGINDGDSVYMCHLGFDKDGKIYYIRPVIMD